jgi:hypothetical protein
VAIKCGKFEAVIDSRELLGIASDPPRYLETVELSGQKQQEFVAMIGPHNYISEDLSGDIGRMRDAARIVGYRYGHEPDEQPRWLKIGAAFGRIWYAIPQ